METTKELDANKHYEATFEFVFFSDHGRDGNNIIPTEKRPVFTVQQCWSGYPADIQLAVKYYMGHYGSIQGQLIGEFNEITNKESSVWS